MSSIYVLLLHKIKQFFDSQWQVDINYFFEYFWEIISCVSGKGTFFYFIFVSQYYFLLRQWGPSVIGHFQAQGPATIQNLSLLYLLAPPPFF